MNADAVDAFCLSLSGAVMDPPAKGERVYRVGGRMFAIRGAAGDCSFKANDMAFEMLTTEGPGRPAPYPARAKWVWLASPSDLPEEDLRSYLSDAHRLVSAKPARKQHAEAGLT